jgi:expansin (peptidoglycan-binding protein)
MVAIKSFFSVAAVLALAGLAQAAPAKRSSTGTATYYAVGLGACGWTNGDSEHVVALNSPQYGNGANCGKAVKITNTKTGTVQSAKIVDLCPGCASGDLDMSPTLFGALNNGDMDAGVFPISWDFE